MGWIPGRGTQIPHAVRVVYFGRKTPEVKGHFHHHHIKGTCPEDDLPSLVVTLITWLIEVNNLEFFCVGNSSLLQIKKTTSYIYVIYIFLTFYQQSPNPGFTTAGSSWPYGICQRESEPPLCARPMWGIFISHKRVLSGKMGLSLPNLQKRLREASGAPGHML